MSSTGLSDVDLSIPGLVEMKELGRGGFGVVYAAYQPRFGRRVAVKVLAELTGESGRRRFARECQTMGELSSHSNVVTVYSDGYTDDNRPYLVMELIGGGTLADQLNERGRIPWREAVGYVLPIADALREAHSHQPAVLHRDIKPGNILLAADEPQLTDFGIACLRDVPESTSTPTATWLHAAPETCDNRRDERSDLYSLTSTLYELIAGWAPHWRASDGSSLAVIGRLSRENPPPLPTGLAPDALVQLLRRGLARDPDQRPQTAADLIAELRWTLTTDAGGPMPPSAPLIPRPTLAPTQPPSAVLTDHRRVLDPTTCATTPLSATLPTPVRQRPAVTGRRTTGTPLKRRHRATVLTAITVVATLLIVAIATFYVITRTTQSPAEPTPSDARLDPLQP